MGKKILIAFVTNAGSTREVAETIGEALVQEDTRVDVRLIHDVRDIKDYDAVVVGGPMILGWHKGVVKFIARNQEVLSRMPVAYFLTALELTQTSEESLNGLSVYQDPNLVKKPRSENKLGIKEKRTTVKSYLRPVLKKAKKVKPVKIGFFAGKLDYSKLKVLQMLFVMLIIGAKPGDFRNWDAIKEWAVNLKPMLMNG